MRRRLHIPSRPMKGQRATPVTFGLRRKDLNESNLIARTSLDAVLEHSGTDEHVAVLASVSLYVTRMVLRLKQDGTVEPAQLADVERAAVDGADAVAAVQERFQRTGKVGCAGIERDHLRQLLEASEAIESVCTRRQARDVTAAIFGSAVAAARQEAPPQ